MTSNRLMLMASLCVLGCAPTVSKELQNAREAYARASHGPAPSVAPVELEEASAALKTAETEFSARPKRQHTRDLAYVAQRRAELAESAAAAELERLAREKLLAELKQQQARQLSRAEMRNKELQQRIAKMGTVKQEPRGTVITLTNQVIFPFDDATLPNESEKRLSQLADGLMATKERDLVIEGHTDAVGPHDYNVELSQKRADAVKQYLVQQGYDKDRIVAKGMGESRPLAPNESPEGRATNRRVEIIIAAPKE